jgi:predicted Zn finger-like uncharacterized protein
MRLICPNCDAEYEVDDAAIPQNGRDVQCSNCGHAWFQAHPEVEAEQEAEEALYEAPVAMPEPAAEPRGPVEPEAAPEPLAAQAEADWPEAEQEPGAAAMLAEDKEAQAEAEVAPPEFAELAPAVAEPEPEPDLPPEPDAPLTPEEAVAATLTAAATATEPQAAPSSAPPASATRRLDESVLAVLREEAEREAAARKGERAPGIETQVEMGLTGEEDSAGSGGIAAALRRVARLKGEADPAPPKTRREMLPAIEEINSTLRATSDRHSDEDNAIVDSLPDLNASRSGFGRGFMTLVLLAVVVVALYLAAPMIGERVPALKGAAETYVITVDAVRIWLDTQIQSLIATLRGYEGGQAG